MKGLAKAFRDALRPHDYRGEFIERFNEKIKDIDLLSPPTCASIIDTPKGDTIPRTPSNLQEVMELVVENQAKEIRKLNFQIRRLESKLQKRGKS